MANSSSNLEKDPNIVRQNIPQEVPGESLGVLSSGYGNDIGGDTNHTFNVPACGIEDCDKALHALFNETIKFSTQTYGGGQQPIYIKKPQVIFATGEKFALAKKLRPPRDKNQVLLLPAISIRRVGIDQTSEDITSRGMNQFTGDMVIKKKLSPDDVSFQNVINKFAWKNAADLPGTLDTDKEHNRETSYEKQKGMYLDPALGQNVFEIYTLPQPQFFTAKYEVIFWTNYHQHMNYLIETFLSSFLPQGRMFRLGTNKGYWFMAYVEDSFSSQDNFDDFSQSERIIRYNFNMNVKGFILAGNGPGNMVPVRRYLSAPTVSFEIIETPTTDALSERNLDTPPLKNDNDSKYLLSDINIQPGTPQPTPTSQSMLFKKQIINPLTGKKTTRYVKQVTRSQKNGETSYSSSDIQTLQDFLLNEDK